MKQIPLIIFVFLFSSMGTWCVVELAESVNEARRRSLPVVAQKPAKQTLEQRVDRLERGRRRMVESIIKILTTQIEILKDIDDIKRIIEERLE